MRFRLPRAVFSPAGVAEPVAAPAEPTAAAATTPEPAASAAPVEPAAPAAATPDPAPVEPASAPAAPAIASSALEAGATPPAPAEKAGETPAAEAAPASTETPPPEEAPVSYELAFPDDVDVSSVNEERIGTLKSILAESHVPVEKGNELLNLHFEELRAATVRTQEMMLEAFNEQQAQRMGEVRADPQMGGSRFDTAMSECMQVVQKFGGDEAQQAELIAEMRASGMGNSLRFLKLLNNGYNAAIKEGSPVATPPARAPALSREQRGLNRYAGTAVR